MNAEGSPERTKHRFLRIAMGLVLVVIGLYATLRLGLANVFSEDESVRSIAQFLIFVGLVFAQVGSGFVQVFSGGRSWPGQALFGICFLVSAVIILVGLHHVFGVPPVGMYLMLVGFGSCTIAAFAVK